jgi:signal transduction histidine kinase/ActR/RegA family two-component response regulator
MSDAHALSSEHPGRVEMLERTALLDSRSEECFDRLTRLAAYLLRTPVAAVSVPTVACSLLKSCVGMPEPFVSTRELPAPAHALCQEVVKIGHAVVAEDFCLEKGRRTDALWELGFRAYAGIPLVASNGAVLAAFCVLDARPRAWTQAELQILRDLAAAAMTEIELRAVLDEARETQALQAGQQQILEMIARGAPLTEVLAAIAVLIEQQARGVYCSILLLQGNTLSLGAAPSLPESFNCHMARIGIDPPRGPCAFAALRRVAVVTEDIADDTRWSDRYRSLTAEHGLRSSWSSPIPGSDGSVLGTFAMYHTDPHRPTEAEQRLTAAATHLAGIAIERARAEEALRERAEALAAVDRRKDEFLAVLAHELRNPLASVRIGLQLQRRQGLRGDTPMDRILERQVEHLARLADDLLDVSRITRGKIELRPERLDLVQLVREAVDAHQGEIDANGLTLELALPDRAAYVNGDRIRLAQVAGNILHNAVKFTERGGRIKVSLQREGERALLNIEDTGVGMSAEALQNVFMPFTQVEQTIARSHGGLGLGLALVTNLVERHRGEVFAYSAGEGKGARFTVALPLVAPPIEVPSADDGPMPLVSDLRILLIEDNKDLAVTLREYLLLSGYEVRTAETGPAGIEAAGGFKPQVIVCDLGLPGMDGYAVARALRQNPATASARLIALSGYGQPEDRRRSREHGFDLHLTKAGDPSVLQRAVAELANGKPVAHAPTADEDALHR